MTTDALYAYHTPLNNLLYNWLNPHTASKGLKELDHYPTRKETYSGNMSMTQEQNTISLFLTPIIYHRENVDFSAHNNGLITSGTSTEENQQEHMKSSYHGRLINSSSPEMYHYDQATMQPPSIWHQDTTSIINYVHQKKSIPGMKKTPLIQEPAMFSDDEYTQKIMISKNNPIDRTWTRYIPSVQTSEISDDEDKADTPEEPRDMGLYITISPSQDQEDES